MVRLSRCQKISCTTSFFQSAISRWNRGINEVLASIIRPLYKTMTRIYTRLILKPSSYTYVKFLILLITNIKLPTVMKNRHKSFIRLGFSVWQKHGCCRPPGRAGGTLVPNLQIGNLEGEALASRNGKLELPNRIPKLELGN